MAQMRYIEAVAPADIELDVRCAFERAQGFIMTEELTCVLARRVNSPMLPRPLP